jgi:hypothetical protein
MTKDPGPVVKSEICAGLVVQKECVSVIANGLVEYVEGEDCGL